MMASSPNLHGTLFYDFKARFFRFKFFLTFLPEVLDFIPKNGLKIFFNLNRFTYFQVLCG